MAEQQTVKLPDVVRFVIPASHAVMILQALGEIGPFKAVQPVLQNFEQQLLAQRLQDPVPPLAIDTDQASPLPDDLADGVG